jgi:hypothetical protein
MTFTRILVWVATAICLTGATLTSLRIDPLNIYFLNVGTSLFLWWSFLIRDRAMITVNGGFLLIYIFGLFYSW